ncbi:3-phosphoshikimate 1-carboxyvinyltransferase [Fusibacter bizertensis]
MNVTIKPNHLEGEIVIPPSKSISHRAVIAASMANGYSKLENIVLSQDIRATCDAMQDFGVNVNNYPNRVDIISDGHLRAPIHPIECNESGSTLRFLVPFGGLVDKPVVFRGKPTLMSRPLSPYFEIFNKQGIRYEYRAKMPLLVEGELKPGLYEVPGDVSSQFITGLMFALASLKEDSQIVVTSPLESRQYVDITMDVLKTFGVEIDNHNYESFTIKGGQHFMPHNFRVEGDYSQAAFWIVAGLLDGDLTLQDLNTLSLQGDKAILDICKSMGGTIIEETAQTTKLHIRKSDTHGIIIDGSQCPDIVPVLAVLAALSVGETRIINASRLRIKESDRLKAIATELSKLGAIIEEVEDGLIIQGQPTLKGGVVDSWNDHRIAMSLAVASLRCEGDVVITGSNAIDKSYPHFFQEFKRVGGIVTEQ